MMKYNYVEVKEEDEYLSSVLVMEVKDRNSEESEEAIKEELTRLEEECIGEGLEEWKVLQTGLKTLGVEKDLSGMKVEQAREDMSRILITELAKKDWGTLETKVAIEK